MSPFPVHGDYRVGSDGVIILFQAFGSWNREGSRSCTNYIFSLIQSLNGKESGILIDSFDFEGVVESGYSDWFEAIGCWKDTIWFRLSVWMTSGRFITRDF